MQRTVLDKRVSQRIARACGFATLRDLKAAVAPLLHEPAPGWRYWPHTGAYALLASLYRWHRFRPRSHYPDWFEVGQNEMEGSWKARGFHARDWDGWLHRWTWRVWEAYSPTYRLRRTHEAGREAIRQDITFARLELWLPAGMHIDHAGEWPFVRIMNAWLEARGAWPALLELPAGVRMGPEDVLDFKAFHDERARLEPVPATVNASENSRGHRMLMPSWAETGGRNH